MFYHIYDPHVPHWRLSYIRRIQMSLRWFHDTYNKWTRRGLGHHELDGLGIPSIDASISFP